jgi:hypothetical protein
MDKYPEREIFQKRLPIYQAQIGKEYTFLLPGKSRLDPKYMFIATLLEYDTYDNSILAEPPMRLKVRVAPEFQRAWGLDDPVLEWRSVGTRLPIFEVPESKERREFAKKLALVAQKEGLPHEITAQIYTMQTGRKPKGYPKGAFDAPRAYVAEEKRKEAMREGQANLVREQEEMIQGLDPEEREAAAAMRGGRKSRRRRSTRRRRTTRRFSRKSK